MRRQSRRRARWSIRSRLASAAFSPWRSAVFTTVRTRVVVGRWGAFALEESFVEVFDSSLQYHSGQIRAGEQTNGVFFGEFYAFSGELRGGSHHPADFCVAVIHAVFLSREVFDLLNSPTVCFTRMKF